MFQKNVCVVDERNNSILLPLKKLVHNENEDMRYHDQRSRFYGAETLCSVCYCVQTSQLDFFSLFDNIRLVAKGAFSWKMQPMSGIFDEANSRNHFTFLLHFMIFQP